MSRLRTSLLLALLLPACFVVRKVRVDEARAPVRDSVQVKTPVKAHLLDGSTVLYGNGVSVRQDRLIGSGQRYGLRLQFVEVVQSVPLDSVVGMESFRPATDPIGTVGLSFVATTLGVAAIGAAAAAIFGSCPTFYSDSSGTPVLEAEGFSYSMAPLFEARDVDRLRVRAGPDGKVRLEIRNEALETHFLNRLELIEVRHDNEERIVPSPGGDPLALAGLVPPVRALTRDGTDATSLLRTDDGLTLASDSSRLAGATVEDHQDYVDLVFPPQPGSDSLAVVLRLRNSLLNTVLLYDEMLGSRGARALDWQATDLTDLKAALALGTWYSSRMGLRVLVPDGAGYRQVGRVRDTGPLAWKDVVLIIPHQGDSVRVRLAYPVDNWRIDHVELAGVVRHPSSRTLPLSEIDDRAGHSDSAAIRALRLADRDYLETRPGEWFSVVWDVGVVANRERTYLLASQGYYTEWIRGEWLARGRDSTPFAPTDAALVRAMHRWSAVQDSLEARFYASRIPVR